MSDKGQQNLGKESSKNRAGRPAIYLQKSEIGPIPYTTKEWFHIDKRLNVG